MIYEFNHVGIIIRDLEKSLAFYQDVLGGKIVYQGVIPAGGIDIVYVQIAGGLVELIRVPSPSPDTVFGINHLGFMTDNLDADFTSLTQAGYESAVPPKAAGTGVGRQAFLLDPNGVRVELLERDVDFRGEPITGGIIKAIDHCQVVSKGLEQAEIFYGKHLGMSALKKVSMGSVELIYLNINNDAVELVSGLPDTSDLLGHIALRVDNVAEALADFAAHGVSAEPGTPRPAGIGPGSSIGVIRDPDGVMIELIDRPDLSQLVDS